MIEKIEPKRLYGYLKNLGPYIYFYNANWDEVNKEIVKNIILMDNKYCKLTILEIDWMEQKKHNCCSHPSSMNTVFLYSESRLIIKKQCPSVDDIKLFFNEAAKIYNLVIDKRTKNIGIRSKVKYYNIESSLDELENKKIHRYKIIKKSRIKCLQKDKIILPIDDINEKNIHSKDDMSHMNKNDFLNNNEKQNNKINSSLENFNLNQKRNTKEKYINLIPVFRFDDKSKISTIDKIQFPTYKSDYYKRQDEGAMKLPLKKRIKYDKIEESNFYHKDFFEILPLSKIAINSSPNVINKNYNMLNVNKML